ncbi:MAG: sulfatase [Planctomycetota bacterium]|nr:sulfatase [Planctomycetota bacterium]
MTTHISIICLAFLAMLPAKEICAEDAKRNPQRPNILFLFSDDHALRTISAYGGGINNTPNIDRIASEGATFTRSFCTNSICCPSRASILTGKHSHLNGVTGNGSKWDGEQMVFPRLLRKAGYQTALIGKWHLKGNPGDEFDFWKILSGAGGQGHYYNPDFLTAKGTEQITGYSSDIIANEAMKWLATQRVPKKPFMLMCQFKAPHVHRMPAPRYLRLYDGTQIPEPPTLFDNYRGRQPYASKAWMQIKGIPNHVLNIHPAAGEVDTSRRVGKFMARMTQSQRDAWHAVFDTRNAEYHRLKAEGKLEGKDKIRYQYQRYIKDYLRCVAAVDENIGRLLHWLDQMNLTDNTIVIYSSDQGYYTGEHGWAEKRWMYEESLRMPLVMRWPGRIKPGTRIDGMVQNIDYAPTFIEIAGATVPAAMQGKSLLPLLTGKTPDRWRQSIYYHYYDHGAHNVPRHEGVRTGRYKLIHYYTDGQWELFDLEKDPNELTSKYNDPAYADVQSKLNLELATLRKQYKLPLLPKFERK